MMMYDEYEELEDCPFSPEPTEDELEQAAEFAEQQAEHEEDDEDFWGEEADDGENYTQNVLDAGTDAAASPDVITDGLPDDLDWIRRPTGAEDKLFDFIIPGLSAGEVGLLVGAGGAGKSFISLELGYAVACGASFWETDGSSYFSASKPKRVKILNMEDSRAVLWNRMGAIQDYAENVAGVKDFSNLYVASASKYAMMLKIMDNRGQPNNDTIAWLKRQCDGIDLLILDPLSQLHCADENSNGQMSSLMAILKNIAEETNTAIIVVHHANKGAVLNGQSNMQQATRGASALVDSSMLTMTIMKDRNSSKILLAYPKINGHKPIDAVALRRSYGGLLISEKFFKTVGVQANAIRY